MRKKSLSDRDRKKRKARHRMVIDGQSIKTILQHLARRSRPKKRKKGKRE